MRSLKIVLVLVSLVSMGFVAGFHTNRYLVKQKISRVANMRYADGLKQSIFAKINASEEQRRQIAPAIEKYADKVALVYQESRLLRRSLMDSLRAEVKPFLHEEQTNALETFCDRYYYFSRKDNNSRYAEEKRH
ncbi:MAG TPA: hypothetical protein PKC76_05465 [Saprospiraceae bacterium]|nr:hypothetical protein [Saprospiraceae bacterium]HMP23557.1 hypothetical protein [Saprospiraceae bacterium]